MWRHPANRAVIPRAARFPHAPDSSPLHATPLDQQMMREALKLAREAAAAGEVPVGAIVYETRTGRILGAGRNTRHHERDPAGHAEFIAIRQACQTTGDWRLNHCTLVVTLEPCIMCAGLIINSRIGRLVFAADDPRAGAVRSLYSLLEDPRLNHRVRPIGGVLREECAELLRQFFLNRRKAAATNKDSEN